MDKDTVILRYEELSIGKRPTLRIYGSSDRDYIESCIVLIKYIIKLCGWTPQEAADNMTPSMMQKMHVDKIYKILAEHGGVEPGIRQKTDFRYLAWLAYPDVVDYNLRERTLKVYRNLMTGRIKKFPVRFFEGKYGQTKAAYCLREAVLSLHASSIQELYEIFSDPVRAKNIIRHARLTNVCGQFYRTPLDFFHYSLSDTQKNEDLYKSCKEKMEKALLDIQLKKMVTV